MKSLTLVVVTLLVMVSSVSGIGADTRTESSTIPSHTATVTPADTNSGTKTTTVTPAETNTQTQTATVTPASTATETITPADSASHTATSTVTPADTATVSHTDTATISRAPTATVTITPPDTETATVTTSVSPSKSGTVSAKVAYPDTISAATPSSMSSNAAAIDIVFTAAAGGDKIFFVRTTSHTDNTALTCEDTAGYSGYTGAFSTDMVLSDSGTISLDPAGLEPGSYWMCIEYSEYNFRKTLTGTGLFTFTGDIDSASSRVCCDGPFGVGNNTVCYISTVDSGGRPAGTVDDECLMVISTLTDGAGNTIASGDISQQPTLVSEGRFEFIFSAYKSGCLGRAGVSYKGHPFSNMVVMFTVEPDQIQLDKATSVCTATENTNPDCVVTHHDQYDNAVMECTWDTNGDSNCQTIHYQG